MTHEYAVIPELTRTTAIGTNSNGGNGMLAEPTVTARRTRSLRIRKFDGSDADYQAIVKIDNVVWPEFQATIENWKHWDGSRDSKYRFQRDRKSVV